jgi:hypothetical protein
LGCGCLLVRCRPTSTAVITTDAESYAAHMCMQCMMGAMAAGAGASGARAWLAAWAPRWLTPRRQRFATRGLLVAGVLAAGVIGPSPG